MKKALILLVLVGGIVLALTLVLTARYNASAHPNDPGEAPSAPDALVTNSGGFEVEVLVDGVPLREYYARGRRYVEALERAEYELRVRNPLGTRVAVALSVDGLNTIDARRTSADNASKWVIEPYGTITISGWQMSSERARRFYFTTERESYGARLGQTSNLGVISAVFFRERRPVAVVPPPRRPRPLSDADGRAENQAGSEAPTQKRDSAGSSAKQQSVRPYPAPDDDYAATGIGRNMRHDVRWINLDLETRPSAQVVVRYEYRAALVRLGIRPYPYPYPNPDPLRRREQATGFEDRRYSPEP